MDNIIDFEKWLSIKNWERPWIDNNESEADDKSIIEILNQPFGERYLKNRFKSFPYLDRPEGS
jgi:hypothetical protein